MIKEPPPQKNPVFFRSFLGRIFGVFLPETEFPGIKVEGNFQFGYHSEIDKKYHAVDGEPQEEDISEINKKYEVVHAKHLASIPEEEEENGRVPDTTVLQS